MNRDRYSLRFSMKTEGDEAEVMIYSGIEDMKWWGDETTPKDFDEALKEAVSAGKTKLNIRINSPGGDVYSAVAMRSMVMNAGFDEVRVTIEGLCASAATVIASLPGVKVTICEGSEYMIHNPMTIAFGNAGEIEKTAEHLRKMEETFHGIYAARTGKDEEEIKAMMDAETWLTAEEAVENGFCDEVKKAEKVAACVSARGMAVMRDMYRNVPESVTVEETEEVRNETPAQGVSPEIQTEEEAVPMEIKDITKEMLLAENPGLVEDIQREAVQADAQRREDIDAVTPPVAEYQAMAEEAKRSGISAMEYHRQLVSAMKQKGAEHMSARQAELSAASAVTGGAAEEGQSDKESQERFARSVAEYAKGYSGSADGNMF